MNSKSTYIPEKLFLYRKDNDRSYEVFGIGPDGKSLIPSIESEYSWKWGGLREIIKRHGYKVFNGDLPKEIKSQIKIVPNAPFRLKIKSDIFDSEGNVSEDNNVSYLEFTSHGSGEIIQYSINSINKNISIIRLGLDRGKVLRDCVISFTSSLSSMTETPWDELVFIESSGPYYENIQRRSEWIRKNYCTNSTNFEIGRVYQMKGSIRKEKDIDNPKQAIYLGKFNFANDTITGGGNPGKRYTKIDTWMWLDQWLNPCRKEGAPISIFTCDPSAVLSLSYDFSTELFPEIVAEVVNRFEKSMWSAKFWKTAGIIKNFSPISNHDTRLLKNWTEKSGFYSLYNCFISYNIFWEKEIFTNKYPSQSLKAVVKKSVNTSEWPNRVEFGDYISKHWLPIEISCKDPLSPIKITSHPEKIGDEGLKNWLGGEKWIKSPENVPLDPSLPKNKFGIKYTTQDGYVFYQVMDVFTSHRASLWKTSLIQGKVSYRQWTICGKLEP